MHPSTRIIWVATLALLSVLLTRTRAADTAGLSKPVTDSGQRDFSTSAITKVLMLGTGNPIPDPTRLGPGVAVIVRGQPYIVDAGEGIWRAMGREMANLPTPEGIAGRPASRATGFNLRTFRWMQVFLTHLHSDHTVGLPSLILSPWSWGRIEPPHIYGPPGTQHLVEDILSAYREDVVARVYATEANNDSGWRAVPHEIWRSGLVFQDQNVKVRAFRTHHGKLPETYGYRFETPDRVVVISGDTGYCEELPADKPCVQELPRAAQGADILIHEVYGIDNIENPAYDMRDASEYHTSTKKLAAVANEIHPKLLVLYHLQNYTRNPQQLSGEMQRYGYKGTVIVSRDRDVF